MNVADATLLHASVSVVGTSEFCPYCDCDPCDCDWGLGELFKSWKALTNKTLVRGSVSGSNSTTDSDLQLPVFDSIYNSLGTGISTKYPKYNKSVIVDRSIYGVGDLVNWYPFYGLCDWKKPWLIKAVLSSDPLDCSYHDYEITDGFEVHLVTFNEIKKMEEK